MSFSPASVVETLQLSPRLRRISLRIEGMQAAVATTVIVEAADHHDLDYLLVHPGITVIPSLGTGNGVTPSRLPDLVRQAELPAHGYCWFGGEAAASREVGKYVRARGWTIDQYDITGYW
jgi:NADPH-dependent ferric siderophore reductase